MVVEQRYEESRNGHRIIGHGGSDDAYNGARILKPETIQLMHSRQFTLDPGMNEMARGF